ncbi:hypothetical protein GA0061098_1014194 [Bradyrhizobium shewense]|uniref:Uncharacterized protein n=1 Tax=Bradyrhizobium shewense TaxID=1761772 RepID=A0A1C3XEJ8_9BRAD|nr:hypothetical protein [Bradyrhizobium shewense]SCB50639.1 hypothetical protein GA0061098_1014194 [Bradyrhizobium shewense]
MNIDVTHASKRGGRFDSVGQANCHRAYPGNLVKLQERVMNTDFPVLSPTPVSASTILAALHESRRREAIKVIHRYRNLVPDRVETSLSEPISSPDMETHDRRIANSEREKNMRRLSGTHLMILALIGFGIAHVIGGVLIARAAADHGSRTVDIAAWGD